MKAKNGTHTAQQLRCETSNIYTWPIIQTFYVLRKLVPLIQQLNGVRVLYQVDAE